MASKDLPEGFEKWGPVVLVLQKVKYEVEVAVLAGQPLDTELLQSVAGGVDALRESGGRKEDRLSWAYIQADELPSEEGRLLIHSKGLWHTPCEWLELLEVQVTDWNRKRQVVP